MADILLQTVDLVKSFPIRRGFFGQHHLRLVAVDHVNITIRKGETLGLVGESGCGKTTLGLTIMHLYEPTSGSVILDGQDLTQLSGGDLSKQRSQMQMIFQDPLASLDPRMTVEEIVREPMDIQNVGNPKSGPRKLIVYSKSPVCQPMQPYVSQQNFPAGNSSESGLRGRWHSNRNCSSAMSQSLHWMCRFRLRSSTYYEIYRLNLN